MHNNTTNRTKPIVSIDGPSYCGKSTTSIELAKKLGFKHINTGAIYRAIAWKAIEYGYKEKDIKEILKIAGCLNITFKSHSSNSVILLDSKDITKKLYTPEVTYFTSVIATIEDVRQALIPIQRSMGEKGGVVMEGRDISTVIFPDAEWKFYIYANYKIRVKRFYKVCKEKNIVASLEDCAKKLKEIDRLDFTRKAAPLKKAKDSILYDNSNSPSEYQDSIILEYYINNYSEIIKNSEPLKKMIDTKTIVSTPVNL